jgi:hypothetical protein
MNEIYKRAAAVIGEDALDKLAELGLCVADPAELARFTAEHKASNARLREVAAKTMELAGCTTMRVELAFASDGNGRMIVTHPSGDEMAMAKTIARMIAAMRPGMRPGGAERPATPEEIDRNTVDTNDVEVMAKKGDE